MAATKTRPTRASVEGYLASRGTEEQQADCRRVMAMLRRVTGKPPYMWGPSIVGFGQYSYTYDSGHSGEAPVTGLAIRGRDLVVYLMADDEAQRGLLARLGKHRMGKSCLYFKRLSDLDVSVLEQLVKNSVAALKRRYG